MKTKENKETRRLVISNTKYVERMCVTCTNFIDYRCTKRRFAEDCARKGLKNK